MDKFIEYIDILQELCKKYNIRFEITEFGFVMSKIWGNFDEPKTLCQSNLYLDSGLRFKDVEEFKDYIKYINDEFDQKYKQYLKEIDDNGDK